MSNKISAKEILNSKGKPTVQAVLENEFGRFTAAVPSGISTGSHEAFELRDPNGGVGVAIGNIENIIAPDLEKEELDDQKRIDNILIRLDGTRNKSHLGANAMLAVSIAVSRAISASKNIPLYKYLSEIFGWKSDIMPKPSFNMIEGGEHALGGPAFQEFMIIPQNISFSDNFEAGERIYKKLGNIIKKKFKDVKLSAEGAYAAPVSIDGAFDFLMDAAKNENFKIAIDAASTSFYKSGSYDLGGRVVMRDELTSIYQFFISKYPIISIEDPFFEEDFNKPAGLEGLTVFGDDLLTSNVGRMEVAKKNNSCSGLILKPNQIGTVSETLEAAKLAKSFDWKIMVANRAGETEDSFIADLAAGTGADFIKSGAPFPKERMAKYDRLLKIEEELLALK